MDSVSNGYDDRLRINNGFWKTDANTNSSVCSSSMPNVCDSDNSLSDVTSVNGSCCLNPTKCSLPWINKAENSRSTDLCKFMKAKLNHLGWWVGVSE